MKQFVAVDLETTGLRPEQDHIIEIGALKYQDGVCVEKFSELVKPPVSISQRIYEITGINDTTVAGARSISEVLRSFCEFVGEEQALLGHNLRFDYSFLKAAAQREKIPFEKKGLDTLQLARTLLLELPKKNLEAVSQHYGVNNPRAHRAFEDAMTTAQVYFKMLQQFGEQKQELFVPKEMQVKIKKVEPATQRQKNYLNDLLKYHTIQDEIFLEERNLKWEDLTKSQASRLIDELISHYGRIR